MKSGLGAIPAIAHGILVDDLECRRLVVDDELWRDAAGRQLLVQHHVFPGIAEILRRQWMPVRPFVPGAQFEREDALFLDREILQDVGLELELLVIAGKPRIAEDRDVADVALAADQHAHRAAMAAGHPAHGDEVGHPRNFRQSLVERRQFPGLDLGEQADRARCPGRCPAAPWRRWQEGRAHRDVSSWPQLPGIGIGARQDQMIRAHRTMLKDVVGRAAAKLRRPQRSCRTRR